MTVSRSADPNVATLQGLEVASDFELLDVDTAALRPVGDDTLTLRLHLGRFGDHRVQLDAFSQSPAGVEVWSGVLAGPGGQSIIVARAGGILTALLQTGPRQVVWVDGLPGGLGVARARAVDPALLGPELPPVPAAAPVYPAVHDGPEPACPPQTIDVMVAYSESDLANLGGPVTLRSEVATTVEIANLSLRQEGGHQFALRGLVPVSDLPTRNFDTLLAAMKFGRVPRLHRLRDSLGADLVAMWMPHGNVCGIAYLLDGIAGGRPDDGFAVVSRRCATSTWTLAHELGHLMGAEHDRQTAAREPVRSRPARPWGYGYRDPTGEFRDLMAYPCDQRACDYRLFYYSTPRVSANGRPYGVDHAAHPDSSADVSRMLRSTACVVARYRPTAPGS